MRPPPTAGKQQEFQREALPHSDVLYNYALRMTNNPADADDLLQETFLKAYRFWESYQTGTNIRAWLFRIMKNSFINRYRRESRAPETVDYEDVKEFVPTIRDPASDGNDLAASMTAGLLDDEVAGALADLPDDYRTVLILCDIEGLTYEEIAEFTDIPLGTVRSRLHRARRLLRGRLLDYARGRGYARGG